MNLSLNDRQRDALERAQRLAITRLAPDAERLDRDEVFPTETLLEIAKMGLFGINIEPEHGGLGAGVVAYAVAVRALAAACPATTVAMMVTNMVAEAIQTFGTDAQKTQILQRICRGDWPAAAFCLSEPGSGSDAASLTTRAIQEGDDYVLDGTKAWVTSGGHSGVYLVMAATDPSARSKGISAFLIDADAEGLTPTKPEEKMGLRGSATTQIVLDGCRVPRSRRLSDEGQGFRIAMTALDGGRVGVSAQACGIAASALDVAQGWLKEDATAQRKHAEALAEVDAELRAGWLLCLRAASLKDAKKKLTREAAMSKVYCTETAGRVCEAARQAVRHAPLATRAVVDRAVRNVRVTRIYEGTSEVQRIVIAREVLRG